MIYKFDVSSRAQFSPTVYTIFATRRNAKSRVPLTLLSRITVSVRMFDAIGSAVCRNLEYPSRRAFAPTPCAPADTCDAHTRAKYTHERACRAC